MAYAASTSYKRSIIHERKCNCPRRHVLCYLKKYAINSEANRNRCLEKKERKERKKERRLNYLNIKNRKITVEKAKAKNKSEDVGFYFPVTIY